MADLSDKLGKENKQSENKELKLDDSVSKTLDKLIEIFKDVAENHKNHKISYNSFIQKIYSSQICYSPNYNDKIIPPLLPKLNQLHEPMSGTTVIGTFLSAITNTCKDKCFVINTHFFDEEIQFIGYQNRKRLIVNGDVGLWLGYSAIENIIMVNGNISGMIGAAVEKNAKLYLNGEFSGIYGDCKGEIYHYGKLIFKDGRLVK